MGAQETQHERSRSSIPPASPELVKVIKRGETRGRSTVMRGRKANGMTSLALSIGWSAALVALIINHHQTATWDCEIPSLRHGCIAGHEAMTEARLAPLEMWGRLIRSYRPTQDQLQISRSHPQLCQRRAPQPLRTRELIVRKQLDLG